MTVQEGSYLTCPLISRGYRQFFAALLLCLAVTVAFTFCSLHNARRDRFINLNKTITVGMGRNEVLEHFNRFGFQPTEGPRSISVTARVGLDIWTFHVVLDKTGNVEQHDIFDADLILWRSGG